MAHRNGRLDLADQLYRQVLSEIPDHAPSLSNLGSIFVNRGQLQDAIQTYQHAIKADPNRPDGYYNLANLVRKLGRLSEAEGLYRRSLVADSEFARSYHNLGLVLGQMGRWNEAIPCYENALRLDSQFVEVHNLLGQALLQAGKFDAAISRFQRYTRLQPNDPRGFHNLALALAQRNMLEPAKQAIEAALKLKPNYAEAFNARAILLWQQGKCLEAIGDWRQAITLQPNNPEFLANLSSVAEEAGDLDHAVGSLEKSLEHFPHNPAMHSSLIRLLNSVAMPPEELFQEHLKWAARFANPIHPTVNPKPTDSQAERILNIGYVLGEVSLAEVRAFFEPLFRQHKRDQVKVILLSNTRTEPVIAALRKSCDALHSIVGLNDAEAEHLIQNEKIDILVDLSGHNPGNRLGLFALKTVPVQASLFGYPLSTGMKAIDYRISESYADPPGSTEKLHSERVWRLPQVSWAYQPPEPLPKLSSPPFVKNGYITFGVMQTPRRVLPGMMDVWASILKEEPTARLRMVLGKNAFAKERYVQIFTKFEIDPARIDFLPRLEEKDYWEFFNSIDISLDTFPANGRLTTADALLMGVPVVTLSGRTAVSRLGLSLLRLVDLNDLVTWKPEDYKVIAVRLARDASRLKILRDVLRGKLQSSAACNWEQFVRDLETAYRGMWLRAITN